MGRENLSLSKGLCCYPLPRVKALNHGTIIESDPQPSSQKRGEALSLLPAFGSQAGGNLSFSYWLPGLDLAPAPTAAALLTHVSITEIL